MNKTTKKGFTLIEILLVIAAISILAGIVVVAINPAKQLAQTRNAQRRADINSILNAVWQHTIDNDGTFHANVSGLTAGTVKEICLGTVTGASCTDPTTGINGADLSFLITNQEYLVSIPVDPKKVTTRERCSTNGTCYSITRSANNRITITAEVAEDPDNIGTYLTTMTVSR